MTFCLESTIIKPEKDGDINNAVVLLHGYGGDGKDISLLSMNWKRHLPNTIFICPDAHETCEINPSGYQWFDLTKDDPDYILEQSINAEKKLNQFLNEVKDKYKLKNNKNIYLKLLKSLGITALQKNVDEIFDKKIIWFNSFLKGDLDYLSKFINFYFDNTSNQGVHLQYENEIISVLTQYERTSKITFNDFLNFC